MLVLSRRPGESIVVPGCDLTVTVLGTKGNSVRLGISAPQHLAVYREEVWRQLETHPAINPATDSEAAGEHRQHHFTNAGASDVTR
jgi:carbon storage regulator